MKITQQQAEIFQKAGNMGAKDATETLTQMLNKQINVSNFPVAILPLDEAKKLLKEKRGSNVVSVSFEIGGEVKACMLVILSLKDSLKLVDVLMEQPEKQTQTLDEMDKFALGGLGNVLVEAHLAALCNITQLMLVPSTPKFVGAKLEEAIEKAERKFEMKANDTLLNGIRFASGDKSIGGYLLLLITAEGLEKILRSMEK